MTISYLACLNKDPKIYIFVSDGASPFLIGQIPCEVVACLVSRSANSNICIGQSLCLYKVNKDLFLKKKKPFGGDCQGSYDILTANRTLVGQGSEKGV